MRKLTIVFTKSKKRFPIVSWLIRLWTNKPYSHVARKLEIDGYKPAYYQASEGKVNYETEDVFLSKHKIVKEYYLEVPEIIYKNISKACFEECGKKYGIMQNVGIMLSDICKLLRFNIKNPWKNGKNCSEVIYTNVIVPLWGDQGHDPDTIKPHHIDKIIQKHISNINNLDKN